MLSAIFWAVAAPIRVEPAMISGGVGSRMAMSARPSSGAPSLLAMPTVAAPAAFAALSAATA